MTAAQDDKSLAFIRSQMTPQPSHDLPAAKHRPALTLSRQTGSGGMAVASELAKFLQSRGPVPCHWTVFDKNLVAKVLEDHQLPKEVAKFMPEDHVSAIQDAVEELLGLHPPSRTLWLQTAETILHLAQLGHVILMGRGANVITSQMRNVFHVRLVAPLDQRVPCIMAANSLTKKAATDFIRRHDRGRKCYVKDHFHADIDDILGYDLVINTARLPHKVVAHVIGEALLQWTETL